MSSKIYCDIGEVPKGKKRGTMQECAEKKQIKYYGEKKVDKKVIESILDIKETSKSGSTEKQIDNLKIKLVGMIGKMKNLTKKIDDSEDKKEIKKLEKEKSDLEKESDKLKDKFITLKKKMETQKKQKRSSSMKKKSTQKKTTQKKTTQKKTAKKIKSQVGGNDKTKNKKNTKEDYSWICE